MHEPFLVKIFSILRLIPTYQSSKDVPLSVRVEEIYSVVVLGQVEARPRTEPEGHEEWRKKENQRNEPVTGGASANTYAGGSLE